MPTGAPVVQLELPLWCPACEQGFDPVRTRWLCPHCGHKADCCEGAPQP